MLSENGVKMSLRFVVPLVVLLSAGFPLAAEDVSIVDCGAKADGITVEDVKAYRTKRIMNVCGDPHMPITRLKVHSVSAETMLLPDLIENVVQENQGTYSSEE